MTGRFGRFLVGALLTLVAAELAARGLVAATEPTILRSHDHTAALKLEQMDAIDQAGVVIIGTSMAQQALHPDVIEAATGRPVYNAALNGGVPTVMEPWLLGPVLDRVEPEMVVWGLSPLDVSAAYGDAADRAYREALETRPGALADLERAGARVSTLISARTALRDPSLLAGDRAAEAASDREEAAARLAADGRRLDFTRATGVDRQREIVGRLTPFAVDRRDLVAVAATVRQLRARGVAVVLVELPVPDRFLALYPDGPGQHQLVSDTIVALGRELSVPVVPASVAGTDLDFVDFTHLDEPSGRAFSRAVARELSGLVPAPGSGPGG